MPDITEEIQKNLKSMKNGNAKGNILSIDILKADRNSTVSWLTKLFKYTWREKKIPFNCQKENITQIYKKLINRIVTLVERFLNYYMMVNCMNE